VCLSRSTIANDPLPEAAQLVDRFSQFFLHALNLIGKVLEGLENRSSPRACS